MPGLPWDGLDWKWGWAEDALRGAGRAVAGIWKGEERSREPDRPFLQNPLTGQRIEGSDVNASLAVLSDDDTVLFLAYMRWSGEEPLRAMIIPPAITGLSTRGEDLMLAASLKAAEGTRRSCATSSRD